MAADPRRILPRRPDAARRAAGGGWLAPLLVYAGAGLVAADIYQRKRGRDAEQADPPRGRFLAAGGARLHYVDIGRGRPVVLIHGIGSTLDDWFLSGVAGMLAGDCRVVAIDRPGSGYSARSGDWPPERQADAIAVLLRRLGAEDAVVVGHSFGALVALALALRHPRAAHAAVLVAPPAVPGTPEIDAVARVPDVPLLSALARATLAPTAARTIAPRLYERFFEPQPVTDAFRAGYPLDLVCRPSQLRASEEDARGVDAALARLLPAASVALSVPVAVVAGSGDALFDPDVHARPLAARLGAALAIVAAGGHMVHHSFPEAVVGVIRDAVADRLPGPDGHGEAPADTAPADPAGDEAPAKRPTRRRATRAAPAGGSRSAKAKDAGQPQDA